MTHLVEILLPTNAKAAELIHQLALELTGLFGGVTVFRRSPGEGLWDGGGSPQGPEHDDIVVLEIMTDALNRGWWAGLRARLERTLDEREIVIRAHGIERL